mgnify:CR=1 FL=1
MQVDNPVLNAAVAALNSGEQPHLATYVDRIVDYCVENENGKVFEDWDRDTLRQLVAYHQAKKTIIALSDNENNIQGVFMWYNCLKFIELEPDCLIKKLLGVRHRKGSPTRVEYSTKLFSKILKSK